MSIANSTEDVVALGACDPACDTAQERTRDLWHESDRNEPGARGLRAGSRCAIIFDRASHHSGKINYVPLMIIALAAVFVLTRHLVALLL
jgi:hypothetical protein